MKVIHFAFAAALLATVSTLAQTAPGMRSWTDQQGRSIKAAFVRMEGGNVVLQLESGGTASVALSRFSAPDQAFARQQVLSPSAAVPPAPSSAPKDLVWPDSVSVNAKDLQITVGEEDSKNRRFVYQSGSFQFVAQAPLTGTVMREIASDFELVRTFFATVPWGWQPKPRNGKPFFLANLHETEADYIAAGGDESSSGNSKDDYVFMPFSSLGLKKVGERYAFDSKLPKDSAIGLITRLLVADMRGLTMPWSGLGLEEFLEHIAYRNGSFALKDPGRALKVRLEARQRGGYVTDVNRMVTYLKAPWGAETSDAVVLRIQRYMDGMLLIYFFGYLDDEGKGSRLHHYYHSVAQDALAYRAYNESGRTTRLSWRGTFAERAAELNKIVIGERTDEQLREAIETKFRSIGVRL